MPVSAHYDTSFLFTNPSPDCMWAYLWAWNISRVMDLPNISCSRMQPKHHSVTRPLNLAVTIAKLRWSIDRFLPLNHTQPRALLGNDFKRIFFKSLNWVKNTCRQITPDVRWGCLNENEFCTINISIVVSVIGVTILYYDSLCVDGNLFGRGEYRLFVSPKWAVDPILDFQ